MFVYRKFDVEVVRELIIERLYWPSREEAKDEGDLGGNRAYMDLRRASWGAAKAAFARENELIARLEASPDPGKEYFEIEDITYEDENLHSLDLGMASTVLALSAAGCVPFSSCNAGAFGGRHVERYPVAAFYARPATAKAILNCAEEAQIGLRTSDDGHIVVYADDIRCLRRFAAEVIEEKERFSRARPPRKGSSRAKPKRAS
jgi:hypothetical protein